MNQPVWFDSWDSLLRILICSAVAYPLLILYVRIVGKRSTAKMNNFDWIVTVAVGSVLASTALLKEVTLSDGALAMALLLGFQYLLTLATSRWEWARRLFLATPTVLYSDGKFDYAEMRKQRVFRGEIDSAVRESGIGSLENVDTVILEPDANLAVVKAGSNGGSEAAADVTEMHR